MTRTALAASAALLALAACSTPETATTGAKPLGDFQLCGQYVYFTADDPGPLSRNVSEEDWVAAMNKAIRDRLGPYKGGKCYTVSVAIEGYGLAQPGVPLVFSPKTGARLRAFVFDNELIEADVPSVLNKGGERIEVFLVDQGGLFNDVDSQLAAVARTGVAQIETWMATHPEWFDGDSNAQLARDSLAAAGR